MEAIKFTTYNSAITTLLDKLNLERKIKNIDKIIIKPNLLENVPPPCTTDVKCVEATVKYIIERKPGINITVIEGSGGCNTWEAFNFLGYSQMAKKYKIKP